MFAQSVSNAGKEQDALFFKTKMCRFYQVGTCFRSDDCRYAHHPSELRTQPDFSKTRFCPVFRMTGTCPEGQSCRFAHSLDDLRARTRGHKQLLEDFRSLVAAEKAAPAAAAPAWTAPPPPPPAYNQAAPVPAYNAPAPMPVVIVLPYAAPPTRGPAPAPAPEKAAAWPAAEGNWCKKVDDEDDLDLPGEAWSRQSTQEPTDGPVEEFEDLLEEGPEDAVELPGDDFRLGLVVEASQSDKEGPGVVCGKQPETQLQGIAMACNLSYSVKNSFLTFNDNEYEPTTQLRRARSAGELPRFCMP